MELTKGALNLVGKRFLIEGGIGHRAVVVCEHVEKTVVLAFDKGRVNRNMASRHLEGIGNFFDGNIERKADTRKPALCGVGGQAISEPGTFAPRPYQRGKPRSYQTGCFAISLQRYKKFLNYVLRDNAGGGRTLCAASPSARYLAIFNTTISFIPCPAYDFHKAVKS